MAANDLTTLLALKAAAEIGTADSDALLARYITSASSFIQRYTNRDIVQQNYTETRRGTGGTALMLRQYPVTAITSLTIDGRAILAQSSPGGAGFVVEPPRLLLVVGTTFTRGAANVAVAYSAGHGVAGEAQTIPAASPYTIAPLERWLSDVGVRFSVGGAALTKVTGAPAAGQYAVDLEGTYTFAAADAGKGVLLSYGSVPADIEQACIELAHLLFRQRTRIGDQSKTIGAGGGHETVSYLMKSMTPFTRAVLDQFKNVVPA